MASRKDMRRADLIIPYSIPKDDKNNDFGSTFTSTMPMAAMFMRNKFLAWIALTIALLTWLGETPAQKRNASTPGYLGFGMAVLSVAVTYMPMFLPPAPVPNFAGTGTGAAPPAPS